MDANSRAKVVQIAERGSNDWAAAAAVLDAGILASVGFVTNGQPFVIPMIYGRRDQSLFLHGAAASRIMTELGQDVPICVSVTLVDGVVLARSAFNHSMNYRSVVAFGRAAVIADARTKLSALRCISDHLLDGRWADVRGPNKRELAATTVIEMRVDEASAKIREGPPNDEPADYLRPTWAGVLPLRMIASKPVPDAATGQTVALPAYLAEVEQFGFRDPSIGHRS